MNARGTAYRPGRKLHPSHDPLSFDEDRVIEPKHQQPIDPAVEGNLWVPTQHHLDDPAGEVRPCLGGQGESSAEARIDLYELNLPLRSQKTLHGYTTHRTGKSLDDRFASLDQRLVLDCHALTDLPGPGLDPEPGDHTPHLPREVGQDIKGILLARHEFLEN